MKTGILTWFFGANYGAKLHSYALWHVLESLGHEVVFVSYYPDGYKSLNLRMNINYPHYRRHPVRYIHCRKRCSSFYKFSEAWPQTAIVRSAEEIDMLQLDLIVCGSDAIFNLRHPLHTSVYFGVGITNTRKIGYAPCCENTKTDSAFTKEIIESLQQFSAVSARDSNTKTLVQNNIEIPVEIVLDPTFLYDFTEITPDFKWHDYILLYTFSDWSQYRDQIRQYAKSKNLKVISVGRYYSWADASLDAATVLEWLAAFKNADAVFTDSFHGLCFSIINHKQFVITGREDKRDKNKALMEQLGIQKSFYMGENFDMAINNTVDYEKVDAVLSAYKLSSVEYLKKSMYGKEENK